MDERELRIRKKLRDDFEHYASKCLYIRSEKHGINKFMLNTSQKHLHQMAQSQKSATGKVRIIIVKGRQQGCSTYIEGRFFWISTHVPAMRAFILTHDISATNNLFEMAKRFYEHCPPAVKPALVASNAKELVFDGIDSGYKLGTAGNKGVGRSSTIQLFHGSECAYWPHASDHAKGILQAVPNVSGTEIFLESTANGVGNYFHEQWQMAERGESEFIPVFIPWYWKEEYSLPVPENFSLTPEEQELIRCYGLSLENIQWRRKKIIEFTTGGQDGEKSFHQEYPCTSAEAFITSGEDFFISPSLVRTCREAGNLEDIGSLVIGVDPARYGDDRTSIIRRKGRTAYRLESHSKKDTMEICGIVHRIIIDESPHKVFIDIGGLGAGIYDRLIELGHKGTVVGVNGGSVPLDQKKYYNKRAEMWGEMRAWLADFPCSIPDKDTLQSDLCNIKYTYDSNSRLTLEKKELMKKRGIHSPDEGDALALTFAMPVSAISQSKKEEISVIGRELMGSMSKLERAKKGAYGK